LLPVVVAAAWFVTVQATVSDAPVPAVKVIAFVPWPAVSVPPVTVQEKVSPGWAGTLAESPVVPEVTDDGAVIEATGTG
jgi:hypothetical protein